MTIQFWGVRGSTPTTQREMLRYGGNTSCVSVEIGDKVLVLDAGTGLRALGEDLAGRTDEVFILLSHPHGDHVIGFPFFQPLYEDGRVVHLLDFSQGSLSWSLLDLLNGIYSPLRPEGLRGRIIRVREDAMAYLRARGFDVTRQSANHPGGAYGYRVTDDGRAFVYLPDDELHPAVPSHHFDAQVDFCRGADVLCHDAQYVDADMPVKQGWGHSMVEHVCELARAAQVRHLILFHHDPARTDEEVDAIQEDARRRLAPAGIACTAAYEGLRLQL